jgi:SNF2 family DNA or RNA helicase
MFLTQLRKQQPKVKRIGLTGTPMPHSPMDLYAQMRFVDPTVFGTSFTRFRTKYAVMGGYENRKVVAFRDEDEMMRRFRFAAYIAQEKDLLDLPGEVDTQLEVELEPAAREVYAKIENEFFAEVEAGTITVSNALVKLLRLQQVTSGALKLDDGHTLEISRAKQDTLRELLLDVEPNRKVVVFGRFRKDLEVARNSAALADLRYGEVSGTQKDLDAGRFPQAVDVLGVQIQAGGVGIDLSAASLGVFLSTGFSLGDYLQARARLHRPGQQNKVTFVHVLARHSIDERVYRMLIRREQTIESLLKREV